jgi:hypothetical protein
MKDRLPPQSAYARRSRHAVGAFVLALFAATGTAHAQQVSAPTSTEKAAAKEAYDRGVSAFQTGDYAKAATEFARADELAPSPAALQAAIDAAVEADNPGLASELIERAKRAPASEELAATIATARAKFRGRGGLIRVGCPGTSCSATLDGSPIDPKKSVWAPNGKHVVALQVDGVARPPTTIEVKPDEMVDATTSSASADGQASSDLKVIPPYVFWGGVGGTALAGVLSVAFSLGAQGEHDKFVSSGCNNGTGDPFTCVARRDDGESAQTRANVAIASTLVLGAATAIVGYWFTRWHESGQATPTSSLEKRRNASKRALTTAGAFRGSVGVLSIRF